MANSPIIVELPTGLTGLTVKFFQISLALGDTNPANDDTFDNTSGPDSLTEYTNREGLYATFVDESLVGWHYALIEDGASALVASGWVYLTDTVNYHYIQFDVPTSDSAPGAQSAGTSSGQYYNTVYRAVGDTNPIHFEWPDTAMSITARQSLNGGPYSSVAGAITEVRAEGTVFLYRLAYNAADRTNDGVIEYELTDGTTTRYLPLSADTGGSGGGGGDTCEDPGKILVDQDYPNPGDLTYVVDGDVVSDASIEVFLYADYSAGLKDADSRIDSSRQQADGTWAKPFYLDPGDYVLRFYKLNVAGPDDYRLIVAANASHSSIIII